MEKLEMTVEELMKMINDSKDNVVISVEAGVSGSKENAE